MLSESQSSEVLVTQVKQFPQLLVMLGTGWNQVLSGAEIKTEISYKSLFGVSASVPGHEGKLVIARISGKQVAFMQGRLHIYEGYSGEEATLPIRVFAQAGVKQLIVTSAAGALNESYRVGDFVILSDLLTLFLPSNPLVGPQFIDMSQAFNQNLRLLAKKTCAQASLSFREGIYAYMKGPHFETPADKMALHHLGADVVGMSTVPETIMARSLGLQVLGLSFVTNLAFVQHAHEDVLAAAHSSSKKMAQLLTGIISES
jgi:purine-nucleoside phosphorylase